MASEISRHLVGAHLQVLVTVLPERTGESTVRCALATHGRKVEGEDQTAEAEGAFS